MIIESGVILAIGMFMLFLKMPMALKRVCIAHPFLTDVGVTYILYSMHQHGVTGTLSAAVGGAIFAGLLSLYAYIKRL